MSKYVKKADRDPLPGGPLARHGGYSVAHRDELLRRNPEITRYLKMVRRGLIRDLSPEGEEHMTTARHVILDRLMQKVATVRLVETYLAEHGILRRDSLAKKVLEAEPITTLWLALNNQIREDLKLLGLERRPLEAIILTPDQLLLDAAEDVVGGGKDAEAEIEAPESTSCEISRPEEPGGSGREEE
jgi:hypothetical protein